MDSQELYERLYQVIEGEGCEINSIADDLLADACRVICEPDPEYTKCTRY